MFESAAVVLAAGLSRRMGPVNKLLIDIDGVPMIHRCVQACIEACDAPVTVVTGYQAEAVERALSGLAFGSVFNSAFEIGQKTSVAAGLAAAPDAKATMIVLGDQPFLTVADLSWLLAQHRQNKRPLITVPVQSNMRGNPLVIPHELKPRLLTDKVNPGCQRFTRENPEFVRLLSTSNSVFYHDIDTPKELESLQTIKEETA